MDFTQTKNGDTLIVHVAGRLDAVTTTEFDAESQTWIADGNIKIGRAHV